MFVFNDTLNYHSFVSFHSLLFSYFFPFSLPPSFLLPFSFFLLPLSVYSCHDFFSYSSVCFMHPFKGRYSNFHKRRGFGTGLGRAPGVGNSKAIQYSCLENSMGRGFWRTLVHGARKESGTTEHTGTHTQKSSYTENIRQWLFLTFWAWLFIVTYLMVAK